MDGGEDCAPPTVIESNHGYIMPSVFGSQVEMIGM